MPGSPFRPVLPVSAQHSRFGRQTEWVLDEMQREATELFQAGEYTHALAEFSVLREIRARREGPYSLMCLSNLHDVIRCLVHLGKWEACEPLCRDLLAKYMFTHGPADPDTVDVVGHMATTLSGLGRHTEAAELYGRTADALAAAGQHRKALGMRDAAAAALAGAPTARP
ncbi:hypothetical protein ACVWY6_000045 [Williamsia sp. R60]